MALKLTTAFGVFCLCYFLVDGSFIKPNNVPRVGRSNEADGIFDHTMGYVIKTIPSKNIPRMGRRNYDSENRYDIPKLYQLPVPQDLVYEGQEQPRYTQEQIDALYSSELENMKR